MAEIPTDEYFVHRPILQPQTRARTAAAPRASEGVEAARTEIAFAAGSSRAMNRVMAVLFVLAGVVAGFGVPFLLYLFLSIGFWGTSSGDTGFLVGLGVFIAGCGIAGGILLWLPWMHRPALLFDADSVRVRYPGFTRPLVVDRTLIRVVSIDDRPVHLFHRNDRFPVEGDVPETAYADALDVHPANPWEPPAPENRRQGSPIPSPLEKPAHSYLYSADGSALPFLRVNPEDVPNVAVIFHESVATPRAPIGMLLSNRCFGFLGGRRIHGIVFRVADASRAAEAFEPWGVVRPVTAADVVEEHLLLPKPLKGLRAALYGVVLLVPVVLRLLLHRHHI